MPIKAEKKKKEIEYLSRIICKIRVKYNKHQCKFPIRNVKIKI